MSFDGDLYPTAGATSVLTTKGDMVDFDTARQRLGIGSTNEVLTVVGGLPAWASAGHVTQSRAMEIACSDETTALTASTNLVTFRMPYGLTLGSGINGIRASLTGAGSTSGVTTIDVNQGGASILSTKLTIDYGELTSYTGATPVVILTSALTDNNYLTVDVDGLTGGADETGLKIQLIGTLT